MATSRSPPSKAIDLELTVVSAKHLKNVNWRNGNLKPYVVFWVDPDRRLATKSGDSGSTKPVWNERFTVSIMASLNEACLNLDVFHSETPKALVGTLRLLLRDLVDPDDSNQIRTFQLTRPSGRPQGKIRLKLAIRERPLPPPDYHISPSPSYYYSSAPPIPSSLTRDYRGGYAAPPSPAPPYHYGSYPDHFPGYYPGYYSAPPPPSPPPRQFIDRQYSLGGPSAPLDYSQYDQKQRGGKMGLGTGLAVGAVAGAVGGIALEEGLNHEEDTIAERIESNFAARDDYSHYPAEY